MASPVLWSVGLRRMVEIRRVAAEDVPVLLPLVEKYWRFEAITGFVPSHVAAQLERLLQEPRLGAGWIATASGVAVGYLLAVYVFSLEHLGLTAEIDELFVVEAQRSHGIGAELIASAEAEFRQIGCTNVSLQLSSHNNPARKFYHHLGYSERSGYELLDKMLQNG